MNDSQKGKLADVLNGIYDWSYVGIVVPSYVASDNREGKHIVYTVTRYLFNLKVNIWAYETPEITVFLPLSKYKSVYEHIKFAYTEEKKRKQKEHQAYLKAKSEKEYAKQQELLENVLND